ncbi:MAG: ATP-binding protein, partial [Deltaproteobacteria bacterium]|nr:ATP-binding protein [Deltaproteobacteria bacterium]
MVTNSPILELQNPWWKNALAIDQDQHLLAISNKSYRFEPTFVHRVDLEAGDIFVLRGPRQVGKTTAVKLLIQKLLRQSVIPQNIFYLSCESIATFQELQEILSAYLLKHKGHTFIFLDEISFVSEWQRAILALANMGLTQNSSLLLTGSNARDLKISSERLPGRRGHGKDLHLFPLSIPEMQQLPCFQNLSFASMLNLYERIGGFPRAIADYVNVGLVTDETYEIYRNWIIGDAERFSLRQETLRTILYRIAVTRGTQITWPKLIENSPVRSHETALEYVEHLQDAFLCKVLHCYDPDNHGPVFQKARKLYFIDPILYPLALCWQMGIVNISRWFETLLQKNDERGTIFESIAINHVARLLPEVYYWYSSKLKKEVDLIVRHQNQLSLYEVKLTFPSRPLHALNHPVEVITPEQL